MSWVHSSFLFKIETFFSWKVFVEKYPVEFFIHNLHMKSDCMKQLGIVLKLNESLMKYKFVISLSFWG